jgi:hypothetical protein
MVYLFVRFGYNCVNVRSYGSTHSELAQHALRAFEHPRVIYALYDPCNCDGIE